MEDTMNVVQIISAAILSLVLAIAAPALAQEQHGEEHDRGQQGGHEQGRSEQQHGQQGRQPAHEQQAHPQPQQQHAPQQAEHNRQQQQEQAQRDQRHYSQQQVQGDPQRHAQQQQAQRNPQQRSVQQSAWQEHRSQDWQADHRTWQQRGGYRGYRIPDDRYRGYFGPSHGFRINTLPFLVVGGYPRFQYQGYWISAVDPWPQAWGNDWYDNDDVYVDYVDNGYYMYNRRYPSEGIAINITF
jgi:hypothetical protein